MADGAIVDLADNAYAGISDPTELNFTTIISEPQWVNSVPLDNAIDVPINENLMLSFSEEVVVGSGNIVISNGVDIHTIAVDDATQVTVDGFSVLVNPIADLLPGSDYFVQWNEGIVVDLVGNPAPGISDEVTLNFSTIPA